MITDPVFAGKVVFLFTHNEKGAQGIIVNSKEVGKVAFGQLQDIFNSPPGSFEEAKNLILNGDLKSVPLFLGGPYTTQGIFFLHGYEELLNERQDEERSEYDLGIPSSFNLFDESEQPAYKDDMPNPAPESIVMDGLYFGSPYTFGNLLESGKLSENKFRFFTGISTWSAGQLENEIQNGAWTIADCTSEVFFDENELNKIKQSVLEKQHFYPWMPKLPQGFDPSWN